MSTFEQRLTEAIDATRSMPPEEVAAEIIALGVVADPAAHQEDLQAIAARHDREATEWRDEFVTTTEPPDRQNPGFIAAIIDDYPDWEDGIPTWHRRTTEWQEVRRAQ